MNHLGPTQRGVGNCGNQIKRNQININVFVIEDNTKKIRRNLKIKTLISNEKNIKNERKLLLIQLFEY